MEVCGLKLFGLVMTESNLDNDISQGNSIIYVLDPGTFWALCTSYNRMHSDWLTRSDQRPVMFGNSYFRWLKNFARKLG